MKPGPAESSTPPQGLVADAPRTFFGARSARDPSAVEADIAFLGVPFDGGTPQPGNRTGQRAGPAAVRAASWEQFEAAGGEAGRSAGWYDVEAGRDRLVGLAMVDLGDVAIQGADVEGNFNRISEVVRAVAGPTTVLVTVGGDHSLSYPVVRGFDGFDSLDVVYLDAHADFLDQLEGARLTGASEMRRISELPFVRSVTALGLRNAEREEIEGLREAGARWATSRDLIERGPAEVATDLIPESDAVYVSVDLDVLDSAWVPGTTLPEPGGPSYAQVRELLAAIAGRGKLVGFDVVELNPPHDPSATTARVASSLITHFLSEIFEQR